MSTNENTATEKRDVYARVTSQIINAIEQGVSNWRMPWHTSGKFAFSPINVTSKKPYRGINTVCLWAAAQAKGYERGEWGTYQQWQERGAQVRKGEKATLVVFWKFANNAADTQDGEEHQQAVHGCCSHAGTPYSMPHRLTATRPRLTPIRRSSNASNPLSSSSHGSTPASRIRAIEHSIHPPMTRSRYRRLPRSSLRWITTARGHMKPGIGLLARGDAIGNWENASAITLTAWKN